MIARVWRGWTSPEDADAYETHYRTEVQDALRALPGFVAARLLRREDGDQVEFMSVTFFDDLDAVRRFTGPDPETAVIAEAARRVLVRSDQRVAHYETVVAS